MGVLKSKLFKWFPAEWVVTCLMLGKTNWCRRSWLTLIAAIVAGVSGLLFADPYVNKTIAYATVIVEVALTLFFIGWFSLAVYYAHNAVTEDEIIIDQFTGILLVLGLSSLGIVYVYEFTAKFLSYVCTDFLHCIPEVYVLGYFFGVALPALLYFGALAGRLWPIKYINDNFKSATGDFLDDLVAITYSITAFYLIVFLFLGRKFEIITHYFAEIFRHIMGILMDAKDTFLGYLT